MRHQYGLHVMVFSRKKKSSNNSQYGGQFILFQIPSNKMYLYAGQFVLFDVEKNVYHMICYYKTHVVCS